ncbi:histone chaperone [Protomyces lactucae-debilis]|uniref:Anti-silencing function protein 1 n=1 Tax=Protomyces lactucae-debilis TaxID=2754530 RepID=A0A1Y2FK29_PROLT|nr:histone chaperone [Protomyces lactucae-debilis]ORY84318.1 histone chaperone [Protomyces lactucae-debilis]
MALINVLDIRFLNNPAPIDAPFEIEIQFECLDSLLHDLEWKLIYVGSGFSQDVELDSLLVGPIPIGVNKFVFQADPVDVAAMPAQDVLGVSVILLTASYDDREFVRIGFYSNNEYADQAKREAYTQLLAQGTEEEKAAFKFEGVKQVAVQRNILVEKPRVTRFNIMWDNENFTDAPPVQEEPEEGDDVVAVDQEEDEEEHEQEEEEEEEAEGDAQGEVDADSDGDAGQDSNMEEAGEQESDGGESDSEQEGSESDTNEATTASAPAATPSEVAKPSEAAS